MKLKVMLRFAMPALAVLMITQTALAADNPWLGKWKLNRDKSTMTGSTITVGKTSNGYHFDFGAVKYDVFEDGQDHPTIGDTTVSLKSTGKNEWLLVNKNKGTEVSRTKMTLSDDGKTLTEKTTGTHADGSTYSSENVDTRVGTGSGLAGTWKDTKQSSSSASTMILSDAGNGKIKVEYPLAKSTTIMSFDGKPVSSTGPRTVADETSTYTEVSATEFKYTVLIKGKPYVAGTETVSADGKVIKDVSWLVIKPAEKEIEVWEKE